MDGPYPFAQCKTLKDNRDVDNDAFAMEPKIDGWRIQMHVAPGEKPQAWTRTAHDAAGKLILPEAELVGFCGAFKIDVVLDGEVVYVDENGVPDFNFTARCMGSGLEVCQEKQRADGKYLSYFVFDILYLNENDPRPQSYAFRRGMLESLFDEFGRFIEGDPYVKLVESVPPSAAEHGRFLDQFGEGSIWKALLAPYPGKRHASWLKYKDQPTEDVIIMGFKPGEGKYEGQIGAVQFGQIRGGRVQTRGYCSGMTDDKRKWITDNIGDLVGQVLQIKTYGILGNGGFRHPQWGHIRDDKAASECVWTN